MSIERAILQAAGRLRRNRESHLIATVVRVKGSAYRRPGARMLLTHFRWISGSVSGSCLEGDIASNSWWRTRDGEPVVVTYDSSLPQRATDDDIRSAFGLGCDGVVEVMLERGGVPGRIDALEFADTCIRKQERGAVATVIHSRVPAIKLGSRVTVLAGGDVACDPIDDILRIAMIADAKAAIASGTSCTHSYNSARGSVEVFVEVILPPPHVFVFGTGHDAIPVVQLIKQLGWDVSVCATQSRVSTRQRFVGFADELLVGTLEDLATRINESDRAVAIVMSHHDETDRTNLGMLLGTAARYIGVPGPRSRTTRLLSDLTLAGNVLASVDDGRLHAPVGLELGAETPQESALAIVSAVQSVMRRAPAASLKNRIGPIHERSMPRIAEAVAQVMIGFPESSVPVLSDLRTSSVYAEMLIEDAVTS